MRGGIALMRREPVVPTVHGPTRQGEQTEVGQEGGAGVPQARARSRAGARLSGKLTTKPDRTTAGVRSGRASLCVLAPTRGLYQKVRGVRKSGPTSSL